MADTILLNIKFNSSSSLVVEINLDDSVAALKEKIAEKVGFDADDIQLILAGKILSNDVLLKNLQIGNCTLLHAFQQRQNLLTARTVDLTSFKNGTTKEYEYYVYCKKCQSLQPGKLRVICSQCKQGKIILDTLDREPQGFEDVLQTGGITGECKSDECQTRQIAQFYFKCAHHQSELTSHHELDQSEAVLQHVRPNRKQTECITCAEIMNPLLMYPCERRHVMCVDCFQSYCVIQLNERRFVEDPEIGYSLPCPAGCPESLIKDAHHFYLLGKEQYERYKNFGAEEYVLRNGGMLCPAIGCGSGFLLEGNSRKITCPICRNEFCRECRRDYHVDEQCLPQDMETATQDSESSHERELRDRWDTASLETIEKISKSCPHCRTKTERSGGCMHMKCTRCGEDWCWLCETKWNRECQGNHWFG